MKKIGNFFPLEEKFLEENEMITAEVFNKKLEKGIDVSDFLPEHRFIEKDGKLYFLNFFSCPKNVLIKGAGKKAKIGEVRHRKDGDWVKHYDGWVHLSTSGKYFFWKDGKKYVANPAHIKFHAETFDKAKSEKGGKEVVVKKKKETFKSVDTTFPAELKDFDATTIELGGSGFNFLKTYKEQKFVEKVSKEEGEAQMRCGWLADRMYRLFLDTPVPDSEIYDEEGDLVLQGDKILVGGAYKVNKYIDGKPLGNLTKTDKKKAYAKLQNGFVLDCLLANWDVIGANEDNIICAEDGQVYRIDNEGSMFFRARGGDKTSSFVSDKVLELDTLRDPDINPTAAKVYGNLTDLDVRDLVKDFLNKTDAIDKMLTLATKWPGEPSLKNILEKRIAYLEKYANEEEGLEGPGEGKRKYDKTKYSSAATAKYFEDWDSFEMEGNPGIKDAIKKQILKIEKNKQEVYESYALARHITVEEYKQLLQTRIENLMSNSDLYRATDAYDLKSILSSKRYKSQFEVDKSHGSLNPAYRSRTEHIYFGFENDEDKNKENRPIYGYFSDNPNGVQNIAASHPPANCTSSYGTVTVKFKDSVKKKATIAFTDSLGLEEGVACTPFLKPHFTSFDLEEMGDPLDVFTSTSKVPSNYTETQFHNQLSVDDIETIHLSTNEAQCSLVQLNAAVQAIIDTKSALKMRFYHDV